MNKKIICFDFDGVINSYKSGWLGADIINDPPVKGIKETIDELRKTNYKVVIFSSRTNTTSGKKALLEYLKKYNIEVDEIVDKKPPAFVTVDDRAICFDGNSKSLIKKIENFKPWYK